MTTVAAAVARYVSHVVRGSLRPGAQALLVVTGLVVTARELLSDRGRRQTAQDKPRYRPPAKDELVSVVVCTLGREPNLRQTVRAVLGQTYPHLELIIVDNDPSSGGTRALLADLDDPRMRVVAHPVRGLSSARNAGLRAARGTLVAYTDDDAVPDPQWVVGLLEVLGLDPTGTVTCVTGRVVAAEIATAEQEWFEGGCPEFRRTSVAAR